MLAAKSKSHQQARSRQLTRESLVGATLDPGLPAPLQKSHRRTSPEWHRPDHLRAEFAATESRRQSLLICRLQTRESLAGATPNPRQPAPVQEGRP